MLFTETQQQGKEMVAQYLEPVPLADRSAIGRSLDLLPRQAIDNICWDIPQNVPEVNFVVASNESTLAVKFYIKETDHKAMYTQSNDPVFKDSCVEFFISVDRKENYYNFEFNSQGTCLASYGVNRHNRIKLTPQQIEIIDRWSEWKIYSPETNTYVWELTVMLPLGVFCFDQLATFTKSEFNVNLYKCGDELKQPHHLSWNPILSPVLDFHQSQYFGKLTLA